MTTSIPPQLGESFLWRGGGFGLALASDLPLLAPPQTPLCGEPLEISHVSPETLRQAWAKPSADLLWRTHFPDGVLVTVEQGTQNEPLCHARNRLGRHCASRYPCMAKASCADVETKLCRCRILVAQMSKVKDAHEGRVALSLFRAAPSQRPLWPILVRTCGTIRRSPASRILVQLGTTRDLTRLENCGRDADLNPRLITFGGFCSR
jgi:hypothetical protein